MSVTWTSTSGAAVEIQRSALDGPYDQLSNEVTLGYVETTGQLANQQGRARRELLEDLLAGRLLAAAELAERAATLGLSLPPRASLLVAAPGLGDGSTLADRARIAVQELVRDRGSASAGRAPLQLITRGQLVVIDEHVDPQLARRALSASGLTGVVLDVADLTDLAAAYQDARDIHAFLREARIHPLHSSTTPTHDCSSSSRGHTGTSRPGRRSPRSSATCCARSTKCCSRPSTRTFSRATRSPPPTRSGSTRRLCATGSNA